MPPVESAPPRPRSFGRRAIGPISESQPSAARGSRRFIIPASAMPRCQVRARRVENEYEYQVLLASLTFLPATTRRNISSPLCLVYWRCWPPLARKPQKSIITFSTPFVAKIQPMPYNGHFYRETPAHFSSQYHYRLQLTSNFNAIRRSLHAL